MKNKLTTIFCITFFLVSVTFFPLETNAQFAKGADIGWLSELESQGFVFINDSGKQKNCLEILKEHDINALRFRVWVNPTGKWSGKKDVATMAHRADSMGFRVMIDFHYSDSWADPGKQTKPTAWKNHTVDQLCTDIYKHTYDVLDTLKSIGVIPEWVQVGNETNDGMLWPDGRASNHMDNFARMINSGYDAIKAIDSTIQVIVHISNGYNNSLFRWMFDGLKSNNAKWDIIGMSVYPAYADGLSWSNCNKQCMKNMQDMITRYQKGVMVVETGYDYSKPLVANNFLYDLIEKTQLAGGTGVFYWEPETLNRSYTLGAWDFTTKKPTIAMDVFQGINYSSTAKVDNLLGNGITIYPNPLLANQNLIISFNESSSHSTVRILNLNGQEVYEISIENENRIEVGGELLIPGVYFIQITGSNQRIMKTFTVK
jgi:arabinogalactan endo-1,4-beta-galactosidase